VDESVKGGIALLGAPGSFRVQQSHETQLQQQQRQQEVHKEMPLQQRQKQEQNWQRDDKQQHERVSEPWQQPEPALWQERQQEEEQGDQEEEQEGEAGEGEEQQQQQQQQRLHHQDHSHQLHKAQQQEQQEVLLHVKAWRQQQQQQQELHSKPHHQQQWQQQQQQLHKELQYQKQQQQQEARINPCNGMGSSTSGNAPSRKRKGVGQPIRLSKGHGKACGQAQQGAKQQLYQSTASEEKQKQKLQEKQGIQQQRQQPGLPVKLQQQLATQQWQQGQLEACMEQSGEVLNPWQCDGDSPSGRHQEQQQQQRQQRHVQNDASCGRHHHHHQHQQQQQQLHKDTSWGVRNHQQQQTVAVLLKQQEQQPVGLLNVLYPMQPYAGSTRGSGCGYAMAKCSWPVAGWLSSMILGQCSNTPAACAAAAAAAGVDDGVGLAIGQQGWYVGDMPVAGGDGVGLGMEQEGCYCVRDVPGTGARPKRCRVQQQKTLWLAARGAGDMIPSAQPSR
jgi:hypothetical protein